MLTLAFSALRLGTRKEDTARFDHFIITIPNIPFRFQGRIETETITEYKDFNDGDGDFSGLGERLANFARLQVRGDNDFGNDNDDDNDDDNGKTAEEEAEADSSSEDEDAEREKMEEFQEEVLRVHNEKRRKHGAKDLKLSKEVWS